MTTARSQPESYDDAMIARHALAWARRCTEHSVRVQPGLAELRERLLALGGQEAGFYDIEPRLEILLRRGVSFGRRSRIRHGIPHRCHHNAAALWRASEGQMRIVAGYALSGDIWRQHSWAIAPDAAPPVIETTRKRDLYNGLVLTDHEAEAFYAAEYIPDQTLP